MITITLYPGYVGERTLRPELERELRPEQPVAERCRMLKELGDMHLHNLNLDEVRMIGGVIVLNTANL